MTDFSLTAFCAAECFGMPVQLTTEKEKEQSELIKIKDCNKTILYLALLTFSLMHVCSKQPRVTNYS